MIMDDNWGLHAVVHGCTQQAQEWNVVHDIEEELFDMGQALPFDLSSPSSFDPHELEDLYKSFCTNASEMVCGSNSKQFVEMQHSVVHQQYERFDGSSYLLPVDTNTAFVAAAAAASNRAKRKSQQKRVVQHVTANGLSTDLWAWRKYGQKPIKGSFYPRSYYRFSSSKGCAARKQVEQSSLDPKIFTITYTADHNHPHPTRRSSLSGVSKNKKASSAPPKNPAPAPLKDSSSSNSPILKIYPATPLMQEGKTEDNGIKEVCATKIDDAIMNLGFGFEKEIAEMGFDVDQSWFQHWLDGRSVC